ncbi:MAG: hypothetical protein ACK5PB_09530 [Pirellula sp.]
MTTEVNSQSNPLTHVRQITLSRRQWIVMLTLALAFSPPSIRLARDVLGMPPAPSQCNCSVLCNPVDGIPAK